MYNIFSYTAAKKPTYGELIDMYDEVQYESPENEDLLCSKFRLLYPNIRVGRPRRFYETVMRIAAPTKPSLRGKSKLNGSPLFSYRRRIWEPRIRNQPVAGLYNTIAITNVLQF